MAVLALASIFVIKANAADAAGIQWQESSSLGSWQYRDAIHGDGAFGVSCKYPWSSVADVRAGSSAMNRAAANLAGSGAPFQATIVFTRPLSVEKFVTFARTAGISAVQSELRAVDSEGRPLKVGVASEYSRDAAGRLLVGQPLPGSEPIDTPALVRLQNGKHRSPVVGVISTEVTLDGTTSVGSQAMGESSTWMCCPKC